MKQWITLALFAATFGASPLGSAWAGDSPATATATDLNSKDQSQINLADTYLPAAAANGAARWPANRMPITYHMDENANVQGYRPGFKAAVEAAMNSWSNASGGKISFTPVDAGNAALQISWTDDPTKMNAARELGHAEAVCDDQGLRSSVILLLTKQVNGSVINDAFAKHIAMHELGHALGILGHSPNADDVMYATTIPGGSASLTKKDANTLLALYSSAGDPFIQKIDAVKMTDVGPNASPALQAMHLNAEAADLLKKMQFADAIHKLEQAHQIDPTNQVVMTNLGSTYGNVAAMAAMMQKPKDADNYFKKSIAMLEQCKNHAALLPILANYSKVLKSTGRVEEGIKIDTKIRQLNSSMHQ